MEKIQIDDLSEAVDQRYENYDGFYNLFNVEKNCFGDGGIRFLRWNFDIEEEQHALQQHSINQKCTRFLMGSGIQNVLRQRKNCKKFIRFSLISISKTATIKTAREKNMSDKFRIHSWWGLDVNIP